jgi:hypothetical protein
MTYVMSHVIRCNAIDTPGKTAPGRWPLSVLAQL